MGKQNNIQDNFGTLIMPKIVGQLTSGDEYSSRTPWADFLNGVPQPPAIHDAAVHMQQEEINIAHDQDIFRHAYMALSHNGFETDPTSQNIIAKNAAEKGAFIPAVSIHPEKGVSKMGFVVNTIDQGFRFCAPSPDGSTTEDLGPVETITIVGNAEEPKAILIPVQNEEVAHDSFTQMQKVLDKYWEAHGEINPIPELDVAPTSIPTCPIPGIHVGPDQNDYDEYPEYCHNVRWDHF